MSGSGAQSRSRSYWVEKTWIKGNPDRQTSAFAVGRVLMSPARSQTGADVYHFMREVIVGDIVFHLTDSQGFTSFSVVAGGLRVMPRGREEWYIVPLSSQVRLNPPLLREMFMNELFASEFLALLDAGAKNLFYNRRLQLRQGAYLTPMPLDLYELLRAAYRSVSAIDLSELTQLTLSS
jgi:hypothetical protein